jgi:hypothetical protein
MHGSKLCDCSKLALRPVRASSARQGSFDFTPRPPAETPGLNPYELRREIRIERMKSRSASLASDAASAHARARAIGDMIPMGQPILVGHHSEKRHRRDLGRIDRSMRRSIALSDESKHLAERAARAEQSTAVSSDDPAAVRKLKEQLADQEALIERTKAANKILRASAYPPPAAVIRQVAAVYGWTAERMAARLGTLQGMGQRTLPTSNEGADKRRIAARIAELETRATTPARAAEVVGTVRIEEAENRVRMFFPDKPGATVRAALKSRGFHWAPSSGAWQRHASNQAWYAARELAGAPLV